jgi:plasmid stabilization system protein ParE
MRLRWTRRAKDDLLSIGRFIARDPPVAARAFVAKLQARARRVAASPRTGRAVPELRREDVREVIAGNYRIVQRVTRVSVEVLTGFEGHHLLPEVASDDEPDRR